MNIDTMPVPERPTGIIEKKPSPQVATYLELYPDKKDDLLGVVDNNREYREAYARHLVVRDTGRNPLVQPEDPFHSGLEGYFRYIAGTNPVEVAKFMTDLGVWVMKKTRWRNEEQWGFTRKCIKILNGEMFDPTGLLVLGDIYAEMIYHLRSLLGPDGLNFRRETTEAVKQHLQMHPNAIQFTKLQKVKFLPPCLKPVDTRISLIPPTDPYKRMAFNTIVSIPALGAPGVRAILDNPNFFLKTRGRTYYSFSRFPSPTIPPSQER